MPDPIYIGRPSQDTTLIPGLEKGISPYAIYNPWTKDKSYINESGQQTQNPADPNYGTVKGQVQIADPKTGILTWQFPPAPTTTQNSSAIPQPSTPAPASPTGYNPLTPYSSSTTPQPIQFQMPNQGPFQLPNTQQNPFQSPQQSPLGVNQYYPLSNYYNPSPSGGTGQFQQY